MMISRQVLEIMKHFLDQERAAFMRGDDTRFEYTTLSKAFDEVQTAIDYYDGDGLVEMEEELRVRRLLVGFNPEWVEDVIQYMNEEDLWEEATQWTIEDFVVKFNYECNTLGMLLRKVQEDSEKLAKKEIDFPIEVVDSDEDYVEF